MWTVVCRAGAQGAEACGAPQTSTAPLRPSSSRGEGPTETEVPTVPGREQLSMCLFSQSVQVFRVSTRASTCALPGEEGRGDRCSAL